MHDFNFEGDGVHITALHKRGIWEASLIGVQ